MPTRVRLFAVSARRAAPAAALLAWCLAATLGLAQPPKLPAFPGAEGFGSTTPGGRGGRVLFVTNLDDSGAGSLRAACEADGPRIVLFRVAGTIGLKQPIIVTQPFLTVAGQSAPGDGVCLRDASFGIATHNVVVRYLRSRLGDVNSREEDCLALLNGARDCILDHCSATWSVDECLSTSGINRNCTIQWCLIGESLNQSKHTKGKHGYGSLARANGPMSWHHNLWLHNDARNPRLGDAYDRPPSPTFDVRHKVIYIFLRDNIFDGYADLTADNTKFVNAYEIDGKPQVKTVDTPFATAPVTTVSAEDALTLVLASVGASRPTRDAVDARLVNGVRTRGGRLINSQKEVGGWPVLQSGPVPADADLDGLPDAWETAHALDAHHPADAQGVNPKSGYTHLEDYLNHLAAEKS